MTPGTAAREADGWQPAPRGVADLGMVVLDRWRLLRQADRDGCLEAEGEVAVRGDEPLLQAHFPGVPIYPGVLMLETVGQLAMAALGMPVVLDEVRSVRFYAPVLGGDGLRVTATLQPEGGSAFGVTATGFRQDGVTAFAVRGRWSGGPWSESIGHAQQ
jgi:3-hydroxymyristoyl/3-hydroxydecanoyl-(acyl carrier protein) dehydratase